MGFHNPVIAFELRLRDWPTVVMPLDPVGAGNCVAHATWAYSRTKPPIVPRPENPHTGRLLAAASPRSRHRDAASGRASPGREAGLRPTRGIRQVPRRYTPARVRRRRDPGASAPGHASETRLPTAIAYNVGSACTTAPTSMDEVSQEHRHSGGSYIAACQQFYFGGGGVCWLLSEGPPAAA